MYSPFPDRFALFEEPGTQKPLFHDSRPEHGVYRQHCRECILTGAASKPERYYIVDVQWVIEGYSLLLAALFLVGGVAGRSLWTAPDFPSLALRFSLWLRWCLCAFNMSYLDRRARGAVFRRGPSGSLEQFVCRARTRTRDGTWSGFVPSQPLSGRSSAAG